MRRRYVSVLLLAGCCLFLSACSGNTGLNETAVSSQLTEERSADSEGSDSAAEGTQQTENAETEIIYDVEKITECLTDYFQSYLANLYLVGIGIRIDRGDCYQGDFRIVVSRMESGLIHAYCYNEDGQGVASGVFCYGSDTGELAFVKEDRYGEAIEQIFETEFSFDADEYFEGITEEKQEICDKIYETAQIEWQYSVFDLGEEAPDTVKMSILDFGEGAINQSAVIYYMCENGEEISLYPLRYYRTYEWTTAPQDEVMLYYSRAMLYSRQESVCFRRGADGSIETTFLQEEKLSFVPCMEQEDCSYDMYLEHLRQYVIAEYEIISDEK